MKICVVLTQYKRKHLEEQLKHIEKQTMKPDYLVVFQNENHVNIENLKNKYKFIHVKSDFNTKYFGRFSYCFNIPADIFLIFDDDIIPGKKCIEKYVSSCIKLNGIIGGNGRYAQLNTNREKLLAKRPKPDYGLRPNMLVDFVGHLWCFKKKWLYYMFSIEPFTFDTGEDMHFCFSANIFGNIKSYLCEHKTIEECSDLTFNKYSDDKFSSYKNTSKELRKKIEDFWVKKGLKFIIDN